MDRRGIVTGPHARVKWQAAHDLRWRMTEAEQVLWRRLRANKVYGFHFRRQQIIDGFVVDFYCHEVGLVVEIDGSVHERQEGHDRRREALLRGRGLTVVRFTNEEVLDDTGTVVARLGAECLRRRAELAASDPKAPSL